MPPPHLGRATPSLQQQWRLRVNWSWTWSSQIRSECGVHEVLMSAQMLLGLRMLCFRGTRSLTASLTNRPHELAPVCCAGRRRRRWGAQQGMTLMERMPWPAYSGKLLVLGRAGGTLRHLRWFPSTALSTHGASHSTVLAMCDASCRTHLPACYQHAGAFGIESQVVSCSGHREPDKQADFELTEWQASPSLFEAPTPLLARFACTASPCDFSHLTLLMSLPVAGSSRGRLWR